MAFPLDFHIHFKIFTVTHNAVMNTGFTDSDFFFYVPRSSLRKVSYQTNYTFLVEKNRNSIGFPSTDRRLSVNCSLEILYKYVVYLLNV